MEKYKCKICEKNHQIYRSMDIPLPRIISEMSIEEREKRVKEFSGFYYVDENLLFANGWVNIEVENYEFPFYYWKTWTSISKKEFLERLEVLKTGKVIGFAGKLEEELPFYINSKDLKTKTLIQLTNEEILVEIKAEEEGQLKEDQSEPITVNRMIEIMQMINHNPEREERKFDKPFIQRLRSELKIAETAYLENSKDFAINIGVGTVLFQIVSNKMLEINRNKERGFGLHLSFDESLDESIEEIAKFRHQEYANDFDYHDLGEIPTYQIDLGLDKKRLEKLIKKIVIDIYEDELEMIGFDSFEI